MWTHFCIPFGTNFGSIFGSVFGSQFGGQELTSPIKRVHMSGLLGPVLCSILGPVLGLIFGSLFGPRLSLLFDFFVHAPLSSQVAWLGQHSTNAARINSSSTLNTCIWHQHSMAVFSTTVQLNLSKFFYSWIDRKTLHSTNNFPIFSHFPPTTPPPIPRPSKSRKQYVDSFLHPFWHEFRVHFWVRFWVPIWGPRINFSN